MISLWDMFSAVIGQLCFNCVSMGWIWGGSYGLGWTANSVFPFAFSVVILRLAKHLSFYLHGFWWRHFERHLSSYPAAAFAYACSWLPGCQLAHTLSVCIIPIVHKAIVPANIPRFLCSNQSRACAQCLIGLFQCFPHAYIWCGASTSIDFFTVETSTWLECTMACLICAHAFTVSRYISYLGTM